MGPLKLALVLALATATAGTARAEPDESWRPVAPFGWRFGVGTMPLAGERRFTGSIGVTRGFTVGKARISAEYAIALLSRADAAPDGAMAPPIRGTAHRGTSVVRIDLWTKPWGNDALVYLDGELGAELVLAFDSEAGRVLAPSAVAGLRLGCELFHRDSDESPSRTMDGLFTLRLLADGEAVGLIFSSGVEFGR
jgi:hypothetical protein